MVGSNVEYSPEECGKVTNVQLEQGLNGLQQAGVSRIAASCNAFRWRYHPMSV